MEDKMLQRLRKRDESAYTALIDTYTGLLWSIAGGYLTQNAGCGPEDIEECVSDVFLELWNHPDQYDPAKGSLKRYLCMIAKNKAISMYRKKSKSQVVYLEDVPEEPGADGPMETPDYEQLYRAVMGLQEPTREILIRRYFYDEKPAVIAQRTGLSKKEVENRLYRGKQALSAQLSNLREVE